MGLLLLKNFKRNIIRSIITGCFSIAFILICGALFSPEMVYAANACVSTTSGDWSASATWTSCGASIPGATDSATIASSHTVTVDVDSSATSVTVNNGTGAANLNISSAKTLNVSGAVTIVSPTANTATSTLAVDGGNLNAGSIAISGANTNRISQLTISTGIVTIADGVTFSGTAANARVVFTDNGILNLTGNFGNSGTLTTTGGFGTINFNGSSAQTIGTYTTYNNIQINNSSGGVTFNGTSSLGGTLLVNVGTLDLDGKTITVTGTTTVNSTFRISSTTGTKTLGDIVIGSGGVFDFTAAEALSVNGNLAVNGTGSITGASGTWTFQKVGGGTIDGTASSLTIPGAVTFATAYVLPTVMTVNNLTVNSSLIETNAGTLTVNGTLGGTGTFTQGSNTTLYARSITITTLDSDTASNTVSYIGGVNGTVKGTSYVNLDINKSTGFNGNVSGTVNVSGNTTVTSGTLNFASGTFTAEGTTLIYGKVTDTSGGGSGGNNIFQGLVTVHPSAEWSMIVGEVCDFHFQNGLVMNGSTFVSSTGIYYFETNDQGLSGTLAMTFTNLEIDDINLTSSADSDITVSGTLALTDGFMTTGSENVVVASGGQVTRTTGYVIGNLQKAIASTATTTFEIGASHYAPVDISFDTVNTPGDITISTTVGNHPNIASSLINPGKSVARYWSIENSGLVFDTYDAVFNFNASDITGDADSSALVVGAYDSSWRYPTVGTKTSVSAEIINEDSFSDFQIGEVLAQVSPITSSGGRSGDRNRTIESVPLVSETIPVPIPQVTPSPLLPELGESPIGVVAPVESVLERAKALFDVNIAYAEQDTLREEDAGIARVASGGLLPVRVKLTNFGSARRIDVVITYKILDAEGKVLSSETETVAVDTTASFVKSLRIPPALAPGRYRAETSIQYSDQESPATSSFEFIIERTILGIFVSDLLRYGGITLGVGILCFVLAWLFIRRRSRRGVLHDYSDKPREERIYYEMISDIVTQMRLRVGDRAIEIASHTEGLEVNRETGRVLKITESPAKVVASLVETYEKTLGKKVSFSLRSGEKL